MTKEQPLTRSGARRRGDKYQDIVTAGYLVEMLEKPDRYEWFKVEAKEAKSLDDIVGLRKDGQYVFLQVKFANHQEDPTEELTWSMLLESKEGSTPWLQKWFESWKTLKELGPIHTIGFITNRPPAEEFKSCYGKVHGKIDFNRVKDKKIRKQIRDIVGKVAEAEHFFSEFSFFTDQPGLAERSESVLERYRHRGLDEKTWDKFLNTIEKWTFHHDQPAPNGLITIDTVRQVTGWREPVRLPQQFEVPEDFVVPSRAFHESFLEEICSNEPKCFVLQAPPGTGKSTYLSFMFNELVQLKVPVIRHHYFLSLNDESGDRALFHRVAGSLMADLRTNYVDALGDLAAYNPQDGDLRAWLKRCGEHFAQDGASLIVIVDGLDHVFREKKSFEELDILLYQLLPVPLGVTIVIGTQPLEDPRLPQRLRDHVQEESYRDLPTMDAMAVDEWVVSNAEHLGISHLLASERDEDESVSEDASVLAAEWDQRQREHELLGIIAAFRNVSNGHPLHLRYCLQYLVEHEIPASSMNIRRLPECPGRDIEQYYLRLLEHGVSKEGRQILHLMAACRFDWTERYILEAIDSDGSQRADFVEAFRSVKHLLKEDDLLIQPFHGSIMAYIEKLNEHECYKDDCKRKALAWLKTASPPEYLKWAHEWLLEAERGNPEPLINNPNREWAVRMLAERMLGQHQLRRIIASSCRNAIKRGEVAGYLGTALLYDYVERLDQVDEDTLARMLEARLLLETDKTALLTRFKRQSAELNHSEWTVLARLAAQNRQPDFVNDLLGRYEDTARRKVLSTGFDRLSLDHLRIAAAATDVDSDRIVEFIEEQNDRNWAYTFAVGYAQALRRCRRGDVLLDMVSRHMQSDYVGVFAAELARWAFQARVSSLPTEILERVNEPLMTIYAYTAGIDVSTLPHAELPDPYFNVSVIRRHSSDYRAGERAVKHRTEYIFRLFTANHLEGRAATNDAWLDQVGEYLFDAQCLRLLNRTAADLAKSIQRDAPVGFGFVYERLSALPKPDHEASRDGVDVYNGTRNAILRIAQDVMWIGGFRGRRACIEPMELDAASKSWLFHPAMLLDTQASETQPLLSRSAASQALGQLEGRLEDSITEFPVRAQDFAGMALLAARHGMNDVARRHLLGAASNLIAYGNRKDILIFQALDSIKECHGHGIPEVRESLFKLVPSIAHVLDYTDGAETNGLPKRLAEVFIDVAPELMPSFSEWLFSVDDHHSADHLFEQFLMRLDLESPVGRVLAATAVEASAVKILQERCDYGSSGAREALDAIGHEFGRVPPQPPVYGSTRTENRPDDDPTEPEKKPAFNPADLPPEEFLQLFQRSYIQQKPHSLSSVPICQWIRHWSEVGYAHDAFLALKAALKFVFDRDLPLDLYELSRSHLSDDEAFQWLVLIHAYNDGWRRYYKGTDYAEQIWNIVRESYPHRVEEFMIQAIIKEDERAAAPFGWPKIYRLVKYCLKTEQPDLAEQLVQKVTRMVLELVSPVKLPTLEWVTDHD